MMIWTLWEDPGDGDMPYLVDAYDEYTKENCGEVPPAYQAKIDEDPKRKELILEISEGAVRALWEPKKIKASHWTDVETAEKAHEQRKIDRERGK